MKHKWRLLSYCENDAATNMAVDEAILEAHLQGIVPPTLRLYRFAPPAVSLGYAQKVPAGLLEQAHLHGFDVVRRPTGGRAVLHLNDLTYAFIGTSQHTLYSSNGFLSTSISGAYKQICGALQTSFQFLGIHLDLGHARTPYSHLHDCFGATTGSDLHYQGRKIIGSAQMQRKGAVLQHGSILLNQDQSLMPALLTNSACESPSQTRHVNLFELVGRTLTDNELKEALIKGFAVAFDSVFVEDGLTNFETKLTASLLSKYQNQNLATVPSKNNV